MNALQPTKTRKQHRATSREQIIRYIDGVTARRDSAMKKITLHELAYRKTRDKLALKNIDDITDEKDRQEHLGMAMFMSDQRMEADIALASIPKFEGRLTHLKRCLAEFDTVPMEFLEDGSVVV